MWMLAGAGVFEVQGRQLPNGLLFLRLLCGALISPPILPVCLMMSLLDKQGLYRGFYSPPRGNIFLKLLLKSQCDKMPWGVCIFRQLFRFVALELEMQLKMVQSYRIFIKSIRPD